MVSSIAALFGVPRSNGAKVALWAANLEPHEVIRGSSQAKLELRPALAYPAYQVRAVKAGNVLVADRVLVASIT